ncbi:DUF7661 family protein [Herbaspirillum seropedicae]|uniref:DUF7661 family protein n=1 Tax=Herbaspirillum seropedicae TaxID=964 RepID=UPI003AAD159E
MNMEGANEKGKVHIFGKLIAVTGSCCAWQACYLGTDGKRRPADFVLPHDIVENEFCV